MHSRKLRVHTSVFWCSKALYLLHGLKTLIRVPGIFGELICKWPLIVNKEPPRFPARISQSKCTGFPLG